MPLNTKKGGPVRYVKDKEAKCLTEDQMRYIYKKVESESVVNVDTINQEIEDEKLTRDRIHEDVISPYQKVVLNKVYRDDVKTAQMEHCVILSNVVKYVQYDKDPKKLHDLNVKALDYKNHKKLYDKLKDYDSQTLDIDFGKCPNKVKRNSLDMYKGTQAEVLHLARFDGSSDLSTTYLGKSYMIRETKSKAEEKFASSEQGYMLVKLLDDTECQILLDTGAGKSYMSKSYYLRCKSLHALPKFASKTHSIQVGNGQFVGVLFIISVVIDIHGHTFEVFTLVSEINENVDLVLGTKNIFELEGVIDV